MRPIANASDALAALDSYTELELRYDAPIPAAEREAAFACIRAAQAWIDAHPEETRVERQKRRDALLAAQGDVDGSWARSQRYRRPDAATVARVIR